MQPSINEALKHRITRLRFSSISQLIHMAKHPKQIVSYKKELHEVEAKVKEYETKYPH